MKTLKFLCVILSCSCAAGLDLDPSRMAVTFFIIETSSLQEQLPFSSLISIFLCRVKHGLTIFNLFVRMSTPTTKLSFAVQKDRRHTDLVTVNFLLKILTQCCARTSSTHMLVWIMSHIQFRFWTVTLIQRKMVAEVINKNIINMPKFQL